jgi:ankyrin repeat protein
MIDCGVDPGQRSDYGGTAFFIAAGNLQSVPEVFSVLMSTGAVDPNAANRYGWTALHNLINRAT